MPLNNNNRKGGNTDEGIWQKSDTRKRSRMGI